MSRSYSEQRQAVYFKAARDLWKIATQVLDDVQNEVEFRGSTAAWAKSQARYTAEQARTLEDRGHAETVAPVRAETELHKAKSAYSDAITRFQRRAEAIDPAILAEINAA